MDFGGGGGIYGGFPDFGAIFMCNRITKDECFKKGLFGLPANFSEFVKHVKVGMLLFLFEPERRNLHGVFEATSDGRMNILPHAYHSSGKSFPAQVCFRVLWRCRPLYENRFRDAIVENYYAPYKFSFGLSKEQVQRLVWLFDAHRIGVRKSLIVKNHCDPINSEKPVEQTESVLTLKGEFTDQISNASNNDSLSPEDYIPLSYTEDFEDEISGIPVEQNSQKTLAASIPATDSSDGSDQTDCEHHQQMKSLYCDSSQKRRSVFSRLQIGTESVSQYQREEFYENGNYRSHTKWDLESSSFEQASEKKSEAAVQGVMSKLEWKHDMWMKENTTRVRKTNVFSRLSFVPEAPMYDNQSHRVTKFYSSAEEANENANTRGQVHIPNHGGEGKNIKMTIQVELDGTSDGMNIKLKNSSSPENVKQESLLDSKNEKRMLPTIVVTGKTDRIQVAEEYFPEDQHKRRKLMRLTGSDAPVRILG